MWIPLKQTVKQAAFMPACTVSWSVFKYHCVITGTKLYILFINESLLLIFSRSVMQRVDHSVWAPGVGSSWRIYRTQWLASSHPLLLLSPVLCWGFGVIPCSLFQPPNLLIRKVWVRCTCDAVLCPFGNCLPGPELLKSSFRMEFSLGPLSRRYRRFLQHYCTFLWSYRWFRHC